MRALIIAALLMLCATAQAQTRGGFGFSRSPSYPPGNINLGATFKLDFAGNGYVEFLTGGTAGWYEADGTGVLTHSGTSLFIGTGAAAYIALLTSSAWTNYSGFYSTGTNAVYQSGNGLDATIRDSTGERFIFADNSELDLLIPFANLLSVGDDLAGASITTAARLYATTNGSTSTPSTITSGVTTAGTAKLTTNGTLIPGLLQLTAVAGNTPAEPVACGATTVGTLTYVDDTDDSGVAFMCFCMSTDDGSTFDWRLVDDRTTACPSF